MHPATRVLWGRKFFEWEVLSGSRATDRACSTTTARSRAAGGTGAAPAVGIQHFLGDGHGQSQRREGQGQSELWVPSGAGKIQHWNQKHGLILSRRSPWLFPETPFPQEKNHTFLADFVGWLSAGLHIPGKMVDDFTRNTWLYAASDVSTSRVGWR